MSHACPRVAVWKGILFRSKELPVLPRDLYGGLHHALHAHLSRESPTAQVEAEGLIRWLISEMRLSIASSSAFAHRKLRS